MFYMKCVTLQSFIGRIKFGVFICRRVILLVFVMLLLIPAFNISSGFYGLYPDFGEGGLELLHDVYLQEGKGLFLLNGHNASIMLSFMDLNCKTYCHLRVCS